jgi:hypothetical protein
MPKRQTAVTTEGSLGVDRFPATRAGDNFFGEVIARRIGQRPKVVSVHVPVPGMGTYHPRLTVGIFKPKPGNLVAKLFGGEGSGAELAL